MFNYFLSTYQRINSFTVSRQCEHIEITWNVVRPNGQCCAVLFAYKMAWLIFPDFICFAGKVLAAPMIVISIDVSLSQRRIWPILLSIQQFGWFFMNYKTKDIEKHPYSFVKWYLYTLLRNSYKRLKLGNKCIYGVKPCKGDTYEGQCFLWCCWKWSTGP